MAIHIVEEANRCLGCKRAFCQIKGCPVQTTIPQVIDLFKQRRLEEAGELLFQNNPMSAVCSMVCNHSGQCEGACIQGRKGAPVHFSSIENYISTAYLDRKEWKPAPSCGKQIAVVGSGPAGITVAIKMAQLGCAVTVFEQRPEIGGVLEYGIPEFRLPRALVQKYRHVMCSLGVRVRPSTTIGGALHIDDLLRDGYDAVFVGTGTWRARKLGIPGESRGNVLFGIDYLVDPTSVAIGQNVAVIGAGNVAMDVTRSSIRLGAEKVTCVYRRRIEDMTALPDEVTGAMAEGAEIMALAAPVRIEADEDGVAKALWVQPQLIGEADKAGRPRPHNADLDEVRIEADIVVVAIGQGVEISGFDSAGVPIKRGAFVAGLSGQVGDMDNVFAGGDCVTGPATAIRAIAAGKVAAANIDEHLGYRHEITVDIDIPSPMLNNRPPHGRINTTEREACQRKCDFEDIECGLTHEGAVTEASRCLRCDHYGYGIFKGGRVDRW